VGVLINCHASRNKVVPSLGNKVIKDTIPGASISNFSDPSIGYCSILLILWWVFNLPDGGSETRLLGQSFFNRLDQPIHSFFLLLDGLDQLELGAAAVEVLAGAMHLVIGVAGQIVGEEADALLKGDQFGG